MISLQPDNATTGEEDEGVDDGEDNVADAIGVKIVHHGPIMAIGVEADHGGRTLIGVGL